MYGYPVWADSQIPADHARLRPLLQWKWRLSWLGPHPRHLFGTDKEIQLSQSRMEDIAESGDGK